MEGLEIAASIIQVAGTGIKLTKRLHEFGSTFKEAKEQTDDIAMSLSLYCMVLKELAQRLNEDHPVHSLRAVQVANEIRETSQKVFAKIAAILPGSSAKPDSMTLVQRFKWNFKRSKVEWLVSQLDLLKMTLLLLVQILYAGKVVQTALKSNDVSEKKREEIETEFLHSGTLVIQRRQCRQRLATIRETAEKEEKIAINASPNDPPAGFEPMDSDVMTLIKYQDDTLAVADDGLATVDQPECLALAMHLFDRWTRLKEKRAFTLTAKDGHIDMKFHQRAFSNDMRGDAEKQSANAWRSKSDVSHHAVGVEVEDEDRTAFARVRSGIEPAVRSTSPLSKSPRLADTSKRDKIWHQSDMGSDETVVDDRASAHSPAKNLRRHTMAGVLRSSSERMNGLDTGSSSEEEVVRGDDRSEKPKKKIKIGIKWRRGNSSAWRDFYDEKLVDFSVKNARLNITRASFRRDDTWTEFKPNSSFSAKISDRALQYLNYPFDDFQRDTGRKTYDSYDSEGIGIGPAHIVYERILKVHLPLVFLEVKELVQITAQIQADVAKGLASWVDSVDSWPAPRSQFDLHDDLPYPNAPLGASGFKAERMLNKGSRWLATGNYVASAAASALSNPDEFRNGLSDIMRALRSSGKELPPMEGREENTGWKRLGGAPRQARTRQSHNVVDEDDD